MRKSWLILFIAFLGVASYAVAYFSRTEKAYFLLHHEQSSLVWLKEEFQLTDTQFEKIKKLHAAYVPRCEEMCRNVRESRQQLDEAVRASNGLSPEVTTALEHLNAVRSQCEIEMLGHIYAVSQNMNPDQGKRFLEMMTKHMLPQAQAGEM